MPKVTHADLTEAAQEIVRAAHSDNPMKAAEPLAFMLLTGVTALVDIADAQQRLAAIAEIDVKATVEREADKLAEAKAAKPKRNFIGQKRDNTG